MQHVEWCRLPLGLRASKREHALVLLTSLTRRPRTSKSCCFRERRLYSGSVSSGTSDREMKPREDIELLETLFMDLTRLEDSFWGVLMGIHSH